VAVADHPYRTHVVTALAIVPPGSFVRVAGRVVDLRPRSEIALADVSGQGIVRAVVDPMLGLKVGDLVSVGGVLVGTEDDVHALAQAEVKVVGRRRALPGADGYPDRASEFLRLRGAGRRMQHLRARDAALRAVRGFFHHREFVEIEAPLCVPSPGLEVHLDALGTVDGGFLITSPEYQLKRILTGGLEKVFSLARCVRRGERGAHHNPEFTMLEWYRAWDGYETIMDDVEALVPEVARAVGQVERIELGQRAVLAPPWERLTVREAFERYAGFPVYGDEPADELRARSAKAGLPPAPEGAPWDDVFFQAFLHAVEPHLGEGRPTILYEWPAPLCALARRKADDPRVVERFEVYAGGLEIANAFGELCDPEEQRARLAADVAERQRRGLPVYPIDEKFLAALDEAMPPSGGIALGIDRLVMLCLGEHDIREVTAFTSDEL
jgi:lysyl-tRNA synthetase class 2